MSPKSALLFKVLLNRFHPGSNESVLKSIPQNEAKEIFSHKVDFIDPSIIIDWNKNLISRIHYSWLAPVFLKIPPSLQTSMIGAFPEKQSKGLKKLLKVEASPNQLSSPAKSFLIDQFCRKWKPEWIVPVECIPATAFTTLLELSKAELVLLIDYLALFDIAEAVRHIVDKNKLKSIYHCLSPREQAFLRICLHKKEKVTAPPLDIDKWDGDKDKLRFILHKRGLFRLSKALAGQPKDLIWYIVHTLDTGRGKSLQAQYEEQEIPGITPLLIQQVKSVIDFIKQKSDT